MAAQLPALARDARSQWLALIARRRRSLVACLVGLAVAAGIAAMAPKPVPTRSIWVAAHDLTGGRPLRAGDLRAVAQPTAEIPIDAAPASRTLTGRLLAAPVRAGEPITDWRLLDTSLVRAVAPGDLATAIHVADGAALAGLVHVGDRVDAFAVDVAIGGRGRLVAASLPVVAVPGDDPAGGGLVIVAATRRQAAALAEAAVSASLTVAVVPTPG